MEITREVPLVTAEESDQCTVTLAIGTTAIDLTPDEADELGQGLRSLAIDAAEHESEHLRLAAERIAAQQSAFDVDTSWWCTSIGCGGVFPSKSEAEQHYRTEHQR